MQLSLKKSLTNWIKVEGDDPPAEFLVDYPTREQSRELQSIAFGDKYSGNDRMLKYAQLFIKYAVKDWKNMFGDDDKEIECKIVDNELYGGEKQTGFEKYKESLGDLYIHKREEYYRLLNEYDAEHQDLWWALVKVPGRALAIYNSIAPEVEFTDNDKKK